MKHGSSITPWDLECMLCDETTEPKALPLSLLEEITDGFSDEHKIGSGGFAVVYKGKLENMTVAVKRMSNTYMYEKEFQREIECLMTAKHKNVVRFLGYCADTQGNMARHKGTFVMADVQQRLLCFEYLPKGSLHEYITGRIMWHPNFLLTIILIVKDHVTLYPTDSTHPFYTSHYYVLGVLSLSVSSPLLDMSRELRWRDRYQIITGICHGLHYLHEKHIVHLDLKPANILLDDNWVPKITDFGISRCFHEMQSQVMTKIAGTHGYLAPESFNDTEVTYRHSYRLDIYSLGVVIIEILTGKKGYHDVDEVVESWSKKLEKSQSKAQLEQVRVCAEIGIECTNFDPAKRPDTQHIIDRLDKIENMDEYIEIGTAQQINPDMLNDAMRGFWFSYQQLNPEIKRCIEYCSIFPKGSWLRSDKLVSLWIAQGFVKTNCATEDMEIVAEGYIQELVSRSFLQPEGTWIGCFTIHDALHDLLDKVSGDCFRIENTMGFARELWEGDVPRDIKHLLVRRYDRELITEKILKLKNLLTLIIYDVERGTSVGEGVIESICNRLPKLRVLAVAFIEEHQSKEFSIPESICQLKNLRYFAFRTTGTLALPRALNKLHHVQLLDFGIGEFLEFNFGDLINLRKVLCSSKVKFPNISRLISLQTMPFSFGIKNEQGYEIKQLRDLNKLRGRLQIEGLEYVTSKEEAREANLAAKERLTKLDLYWTFADSGCNPEVETEVLEGLCPPVGLHKLRIYYYRGSRYPHWMVGKQNSNLQKLKLCGWSQLGPAPEFVEAFPHLRVLDLDWCNWNALPDNMEHLKSLKKLKIEFCGYILSLPTLPQSLEEFHLWYCTDEFIKSCLTFGHPNWHKIEHVTNKTFRGLSTVGRMEAKIWSGINRFRVFWRCNTA